MMVTSNIGCRTRQQLRAFSILSVMLLSLTLPACGDKEAPIDPSHLAEVRHAKEAAEHEKSQRLLAEDRFGKLLLSSVLGIGVALAIGVAIGSSSRRRSEVAPSEGTDGDV